MHTSRPAPSPTAQVYNREMRRHQDFCMSCYDADVTYHRATDTYRASYLRMVSVGARRLIRDVVV